MPVKEEKQLAERLIQRRALLAVRDTVESFIQKFDPDRDTCQVGVRLESLDSVKVDFMHAQDAIERLDKPEMLDEHINQRVEFEQRYCDAKGFLLTKRATEFNQAIDNTSASFHTSSSGFHLRLPKIDLPRFCGDFSRWLSFRDTFTSMVHANRDIPTVYTAVFTAISRRGGKETL